MLPIIVTTGMTACLFSFILATSPIKVAHKNGNKFHYKLILKGLIFGTISSLVVSGLFSLFLLYGLSQIIGATIGITSCFIYWYFPNNLVPVTRKGMIAMTIFPIVTVLIFAYGFWPFAEKHLPSIAYPFGTWDSRARIENNIAQSMSVGDQLSQYKNIIDQINGHIPESKEGGFILGHMPTYSFCVKDRVILKIKVFEQDRDIWIYNKCSDH